MQSGQHYQFIILSIYDVEQKYSRIDRKMRWQVLHKLYVKVKNEEAWRRQTNNEIREIYKYTCIIQKWKLWWLGNVRIMSDKRHQKRVISGSKSRMKKKKNRKDLVRRGKGIKSVLNWIEKNKNQENWTQTAEKI